MPDFLQSHVTAVDKFQMNFTKRKAAMLRKLGFKPEITAALFFYLTAAADFVEITIYV